MPNRKFNLQACIVGQPLELPSPKTRARAVTPAVTPSAESCDYPLPHTDHSGRFFSDGYIVDRNIAAYSSIDADDDADEPRTPLPPLRTAYYELAMAVLFAKVDGVELVAAFTRHSGSLWCGKSQVGYITAIPSELIAFPLAHLERSISAALYRL